MFNNGINSSLKFFELGGLENPITNKSIGIEMRTTTQSSKLTLILSATKLCWMYKHKPPALLSILWNENLFISDIDLSCPQVSVIQII